MNQLLTYLLTNCRRLAADAAADGDYHLRHHRRNIALHCVSKKLTLFLFLRLLGQMLTDFNNIW